MTPRFSSFIMTACSISGRMSFLMLLFLLRTLDVTLVFLSGAGSGFFSTAGLLSEKLLESAKEISLNPPFMDKPGAPATGGRVVTEHAVAKFHSKLHANASVG